MRRKKGVLLPLERSILNVALDLQTRGAKEFHGFLIASRMSDREDQRSLTAYGTLYKALERMERAGWLTSRWEEAERAAEENRPRRRLYTVTGMGADAVEAASRDADSRAREGARG